MYTYSSSEQYKLDRYRCSLFSFDFMCVSALYLFKSIGHQNEKKFKTEKGEQK